MMADEQVLPYDVEFEGDIDDWGDAPEAILADPEKREAVKKAAWWPQDEVKADRYLARIQRLEEQVSEVTATYNAEIQRYQQTRDERISRLRAAQHKLATLLELYHYIERDPREKTVILPHGELQRTTRKAGVLKATDEAALMDLVSQNEADFELFVDVKPTLRWAELKKHLALHIGESSIEVVRSDTGEVLPIALFEVRAGEQDEWRYSIGTRRTKQHAPAPESTGGESSDNDTDGDGEG